MTDHSNQLNQSIRNVLSQFAAALKDRSGFQAVISEVERLPEYRACLETMQTDSTIAEHFGKRVRAVGMAEYSDLSPQSALRMLLHSYAEGWFTDIEGACQNFQNTFYKNSFECEAIAPLQGILLSPSLEVLAENGRALASWTGGVQIRALTAVERTYVYDLELVRRISPTFTDQMYAITKRFLVPKKVESLGIDSTAALDRTVDRQLGDIRDSIEESLQIMRLFKKGNIRQAGILYKVNSFLLGNSIRSSPKPIPDALSTVFRPYEFKNEDDLAGLEGLWNGLQSAKRNLAQRLRVALRWFSHADEHYRTDDRVIDLMISAEVLGQCAGDSNKKQCIAHEISTLFPERARSEVKTCMERIYDARNSIMHEGAWPAWLKKAGRTQDGILQLVDAAEEHLRKALKIKIQAAANPLSHQHTGPRRAHWKSRES